jgi:uncharacterized protein
LATEHPVALAGEELVLLGDRALAWPAQRALLIADLHLGKADVLRRAGILAPRGSTGDDLGRLAALLARHRPATLWVLGDLLHGPLRDGPWLQRWLAFRAAHAALAIRVVAGNHDRALDPARLGIERVDEPVGLGALRLCHAPPGDAGAPYLCGHLHPRLRLPGVPRAWPAFRLDVRGLVLPAFSLLTGGSPADAGAAACFACVDGAVVAVPARRRRRRGG